MGQGGSFRTGFRVSWAWLGLAAVLALLPGCATLRSLGVERESEETASLERPEASPEYDFMVGQMLEMDGHLPEASAAYARALAKDPDSLDLLKKLAELAARQNQLDVAVAHAERAHALAPDDVGVRVFLGTVLRIQGSPERASEVLRDENGDPISKEAALLLFGLLMDTDRLDEALATATWLHAQEPDSARGAFAMAAALHKMGRPEEAEATLRESLGEQVDDIAVYHAIARLRREAEDREGEIAVYREVLEKHPGHRATLGALVDALVAEDRLDEAVGLLEEVERRYPEDLRSRVRLGFLLFERRDFAGAAERFESVLALSPVQGEIAYFLGVTRRRLGEEEAARAAFERIPTEDERYAEARAQIAGIFEERGEYDLAMAEVELARARQPGRELDLYLASLRAKSGDFEGAVAFLEGLLAESPDDPEVLYSLGVIHGDARRQQEALGYMERALAKNADHAGALNYLGYTWAERGENLELAERYVRRALELRPDDGYITDSLGWVFYMRARPLLQSGQVKDGRALLELAVQNLERAQELTGGDPVIAEHLGDAYLLLDRKRHALEKYQEAIGLGPRLDEQPQLHQKYERLQRELDGR
jgi:tetratricopeptide (TPR) repeat protein